MANFVYSRTNQSVKKYTTTDASSKTEIDAAKVEHHAQWDGLHGAITNIKHDSAGRLGVIEESFRINKHNFVTACFFYPCDLKQLRY